MERGGLTNSPFSVYGNFENKPNSWLQPAPPPPLSSSTSFFWDQQNNFSSPQDQQVFYDTNQTIPLFDDHLHPSNSVGFSGFPSNFGGGIILGPQYIEGLLDHSSFGQETGFIDGFVHLDENGYASDSSPMNGKEKKARSSTIPWIKGQWTIEEDRKLKELVERYGYRKWAIVAQHMEGRIGKQCRERWQNHLRPDIKKDQYWSEEEEMKLIEAHKKVGNKWAEIAKYIPGRTENSIKNHWNATKRKQTSKRKIKKVATHSNGVKQSVLLDEYIRKLYFNKGSSSSSSISNSNDLNAPPSPSDGDTPISLFTNEDYHEEEMNFMTNLFGDKDIRFGSNFSKNGFVNCKSTASYLTSVTQIPSGNMGNNLVITSSPTVHNHLEQNGVTTGIPKEEAPINAYMYPELFFPSSMLDASLGSSGPSLGW